jgi:hypothetical protein
LRTALQHCTARHKKPTILAEDRAYKYAQLF